MCKISVIMPTYNAEEYLDESIKSIQNQTYGDFELLIIDDNSNDRTRDIVNFYAEKDSRIKLINGPQKGIAEALNKGIDIAKGEYIARMDADDISLPERFQKQNCFLDNNPEIDIVGTWFESFPDGKIYKHPAKVTYVNMLQYCCIGHPTIMFRKKSFDKYNLRYNSDYYCEDYELWSRAIRYLNFYNLQEVLLKYRQHPNKLSLDQEHLHQAEIKLKENMLNFLTNEPELKTALKNVIFAEAKKNTAKEIIQNIFSVTNEKNTKLIKIMGIKIRIKRKIKPLLSVIIPIYNTEKYLAQCLKSVTNQTYKNIEIICINDGSTDNSMDILRKFAESDERIIIINTPNQGMASSWNIGLKIAKGEYITFVDSDDYIEPNTYKRVLKYATKNDIVCWGIKIQSEYDYPQKSDDQNYYKIRFKGHKKLNNNIIFSMDCSSCNKIFKRSIITEYKLKFPNGLYYEDAAFFYKYIACCKNAYFIKKYFYNYRRSRDSVMSQTFSGCSQAIDHLHIIKDVFDFYKEKNILDSNKDLFITLFERYCKLAYNYARQEDRPQICETINTYEIYFNKYIPIQINSFQYKN